MPRIIAGTRYPITANPSTSPVNGVLDNFNRADSASTIGSNWTANTTSGSNSGNQGISSNQVYNPFSGFSNYTSMYWNTQQFSIDQEAYMTIATLGSYNANDNPRVYVRISNPGASYNGYYLSFFDSNGGLYIKRVIKGVATTIGGSVSYSPASGDKLRLEIIGNTLRGYTNHAGVWTLRITRTDEQLQQGGYIGFYIPGNTQDGRYDDFGGGSLTPGVRTVAGARTLVS